MNSTTALATAGGAATATGPTIGPHLDASQLLEAGLSPREIEVLSLASRGLINDAIGLTLGISPRTVQKHLERVHAKLGVGTRQAAVATAYAISWGPRQFDQRLAGVAA